MWIYGQDNRVKGTVGPWVFSKVFPFSAPKYEEGDTVGCGVDFVRGVIFFTKNGVLLGKRIFHISPAILRSICTVVSLKHPVQAMPSRNPPTAGCFPL
jgi:hypothetical protein